MATGKLTQTTAQIQTILDNASNTATPSKQGLMSSDDKAKLDGIETGAQVNLNNFTRIDVYNSSGDKEAQLTPSAMDDILSIYPLRLDMYSPAENELQIELTKANVENALGYTPATSDHTHTQLGAVEFTGDITADQDIQINDSTLETLWNSVFG